MRTSSRPRRQHRTWRCSSSSRTTPRSCWTTDLTAAVRTKIAASATRATRDFNWSELIILGALIKHAGEIGREAKVNDVLLREPDDA
jgi:hypothetical protein